MSIKKDLNELISLLTRIGCIVTVGGNSHYKVAYGTSCVFVAASPSDYRAFLNIRRDIRHYLGFDIRDYGWTK